MASEPTFHRPDKPHLPGYDGWQGAGTVLTWLGLCSWFSTCPFALVLCIERLRDPRRTDEHRHWDKATLVFALPGAAFWLLVCLAIWGYGIGGCALGISGYWCVFALWLFVRRLTRWRQIAEFRRLDAKSRDAVPIVSATSEPRE